MITTVAQAGRAPLEAYVGDSKEGVVHRYGMRCADVGGVYFLFLRTALLHGYRRCSCCLQQVRAEA